MATALAIWTFIKAAAKYWYLPVILILLGAAWFYKVDKEHQENKAELAQQQLTAATKANRENIVAIQALQKAAADARVVDEAEAVREKKSNASLAQVKKDQANEPGASDIVSPYFDSLAKRLHDADAGSQQ